MYKCHSQNIYAGIIYVKQSCHECTHISEIGYHMWINTRGLKIDVGSKNESEHVV